MRKLFLLIAAVGLVGCGEVAPANLSDWVLQNEGEFSLSVPADYERIVADKVDLILPTDFVVGFSEIRLDNDFASTLTVHKEALNADYLSETYMQGIRQKNANLPDYAEKAWLTLMLGSTEALQSEFVFSITESQQKIYAVQTAAVKNGAGYIVSCLSVESEEAKIANCRKMVASFVLK